MLENPLRVAILGGHPSAEIYSLQVTSTPGMDLAWQGSDDLEELAQLLHEQPVDVFIEAHPDLAVAAQSALLAIAHNAHLVLTQPRLDVTLGLKLQAEAYQKGIIITSDLGTLHGTLASMIQEAHIMGFDLIQAGQISGLEESVDLQYEMAALANGFALLPDQSGMTGPEIKKLEDIIPAFDLESYQGRARVDYVRCASALRGPYLIVKARNQLSDDQRAQLKKCQLGEGPYFLLHRNLPLGPFETPKTILGAAAGQAILTPAYPTCDVYADSTGQAILLPYQEELAPRCLLAEPSNSHEDAATLAGSTLQDSALTHLWAEQRKIIESQPKASRI